MRKTLRYISAVAAVMTALSLASCGDDSDDNIGDSETEMAHLKEGDILTRRIDMGGHRIEIKDQMVNYGDEDSPVLFSVTQSINIDKEKLDGTVFTVTKPMIEKFLSKWAQIKAMPFDTKEEKVSVALDVYRYFYDYNIDIYLFMNLVNDGFSPDILLRAADQTRAADADVNDALYAIWKHRDMIPADTRGTVRDIKGIIEGVADLYEVWKDFSDNNPPIEEAVDGYCSFLNSADLDLNNYIDNSICYYPVKLEYDAGLWEAKFHYQVSLKGGYHKSLPGHYIPKVYIQTTYLHVKGPSFIGAGKYKFSPVVNISQDPDSPVVQANGMVQVTYGDCCCFRYVSYLNFSANGYGDLDILSFDEG